MLHGQEQNLDRTSLSITRNTCANPATSPQNGCCVKKKVHCQSKLSSFWVKVTIQIFLTYTVSFHLTFWGFLWCHTLWLDNVIIQMAFIHSLRQRLMRCMTSRCTRVDREVSDGDNKGLMFQQSKCEAVSFWGGFFCAKLYQILPTILLSGALLWKWVWCLVW